MKQITLNKVNEAIGAKFPNVKLAKGNGYFYIYSDNQQTALMLAGLYSTGIYGVRNLSDLPVDRWVKEVEGLMAPTK